MSDKTRAKMLPYLECKEYFKSLARRCLNDEHFIVREEIQFLMDFLRSLNSIEPNETLVKAIRICVYNIVEIHDPQSEYKNYTFMDKNIKQYHGIAWMIDKYFFKDSVNKYYSILMTALKNPTRHSIVKLSNTFEIDLLRQINYKYFLVKLMYFNLRNKLKSLDCVEKVINSIYNCHGTDLSTIEKIVGFLTTQNIYSISQYHELILKLDLIYYDNVV